jgi:RNA polymerase sigma factor (TIGR02999 family)
MSEITRLLSAAEEGDPHAAERLLPLVYNELRELAAQRLAREKPGQTTAATSLVHEAYSRLVDGNQAQHWTGRGHFFAAAAESMRRILVDQARRKKAIKHGGATRREELNEAAIAAPEPAEDVLAVNDALELLAAVHPQAARLVTLRFFGGLNMSEAAQALDMSVRSAHQLWAYARSWLREKMRPS